MTASDYAHQCGRRLLYCRLHRWWVCPACDKGVCVHICSHTGDLAPAARPQTADEWAEWIDYRTRLPALVRAATAFGYAQEALSDELADLNWRRGPLPQGLLAATRDMARDFRRLSDELEAATAGGAEERDHDPGEEPGGLRVSRVAVTEVEESDGLAPSRRQGCRRTSRE